MALEPPLGAESEPSKPSGEESFAGAIMQQTLAGVVERVIFRSEETGFSVLLVRTSDDQPPSTVVGTTPRVHAHEYVDATGQWVDDAQHGRQFRAAELRVAPPRTREGIEKYLASGLVDGVGPHFARQLVEAFGDQLFEVIENDPDRLLTIHGIGKSRQQRLVDAWEEHAAIRDIMVFLHSHGLGTARAAKVFKTYGSDALSVVRRNPFRLATDITGIGFHSADSIAKNLGMRADSPLRAAAGLLFVLKEASTAGHCALLREDWLRQAIALLEIGDDVVRAAADEVIASGEVVEEQPIQADRETREPNEPRVYLSHLHRAEVRLARGLARLQAGPRPLEAIRTEPAIDWVEERNRIRLSESQRAALATALGAKVVVVTGGPGVGKTTLVRSLLEIFRAKKLRCVLCAPTGRAARRLAETTGADAATIHRLLEFNPRAGGFVRNDDHPLAGDVVILDEASMVDVRLMQSLVRAIPANAAFVVVGDVDQLPSVGPGQVLRDVIASEAVPVVRLTEIFRQKDSSRIVENAHRIRRGEIPISDGSPDEMNDFYFIESDLPEDIASKVVTLVKDRIPRRFELDSIGGIQVLTPMKRSVLGTEALNSRLQAALNPTARQRIARRGIELRAGDKVMQTENNYDKDVFNGDVGRVISIDHEEKQLSVDFGRVVSYRFGELDQLTLAYACSIHKSQGSEYPAVVIPLHTQHFVLLQRNVLYTAVTRGKRLVVLVGSRRALQIAVDRTDGGERLTGLRERLRAACGVR